ncbi:MAG: mandelate racemase/muconate lactonizing enzyme family protein [Hyphomicrobiales bacterium]|nr:mandelate racemase/muconate lactonizing enzyme family protein [Hyphomicrobiales bacterium]
MGGRRVVKITRIEAIHVRIALPRDFRGSIYHVPEKNAVITRIYTDHGPMGEAINGEGNAESHAAAVKVIETELTPRLIGQDASNIEALWTKMWAATHVSTRDRRPEVRAIACIDSALWDIKGKQANMPLYKLWGGARDSLPIIAIGGQYHDGYAAADYGKEVAFYKDYGLAGCKFKVGGKTPAEDAHRTRAARAAVGDDFVLCVDANRGWSLATALEYCRHVRDLDLRWFEEPCHWHDDKRDMAQMRLKSGLPICAGQSEITAEACRDLVLTGAIDVCNLDASWGGGPTAWLRVAKMAACFGVEMGHHGEPVVGSHLLAAVANGTYVETHHPDRDPIFHKMVGGRGKIANGYYELPQAHGWGVTLDEEMIAKYRVN